MSSADDTIRLKVEEESSQVVAAKQKVAQYRAELRELQEAFDRGAVHSEQFRAESARLERQLARTAAELDAVRAKAGGMSGSQLGMGVNQLAQGLEDLQYSVGGAMNNLGAAIAMFGGPAGLVAGATIAGIAINQLVRHWSELEERFGTGVLNPAKLELESLSDELKKATDRMEELSKQTRLTLEEMDEFKNLKGTIGALKAEQEQRRREDKAVNITSNEADQAQADWQAIVKESGGGEAIKGKIEEAYGRNAKKGFFGEQVVQDINGKWVSPSQAAKTAMEAASRGEQAGLDAVREGIGSINPDDPMLTSMNVHSAKGRRESADMKFREETKQATEKAIADRLQAEYEAASAEGVGPTEAEKARFQDTVKRGDNLRGQFGIRTLMGEKVGEDWVKQGLQNQGVSETDAKEAAATVLQKLRDQFNEQLASKAAEKGTTREGAFQVMRGERMTDLQNYQYDLIAARLGIAGAQMSLAQNLFKAPERIAAQDFARKAEGSTSEKDMLQTSQSQLAELRQIAQYTKLLQNPPKLGR